MVGWLPCKRPKGTTMLTISGKEVPCEINITNLVCGICKLPTWILFVVTNELEPLEDEK